MRKIKKFRYKKEKVNLRRVKKNNLLNYFNNTQIVIYTNFNKTNEELVYQYLLLKEGLVENLLIESGNIIYVINNIRKFC